MKEFVRTNYPTSKLPEDLREGLDPSGTVTVTIIREEERPKKVLTLEKIFARRRPPFRTADEIDADIRQQRDEWDD